MWYTNRNTSCGEERDTQHAHGRPLALEASEGGPRSTQSRASSSTFAKKIFTQRCTRHSCDVYRYGKLQNFYIYATRVTSRLFHPDGLFFRSGMVCMIRQVQDWENFTNTARHLWRALRTWRQPSISIRPCQATRTILFAAEPLGGGTFLLHFSSPPSPLLQKN